MEFLEFKGKTIDEALIEASIKLGVASNQITYEVINKGSNGLFGLFNKKPAVIKVTVKNEEEKEADELIQLDIADDVANEDVEKIGTEFAGKIFTAMGFDVQIKTSYDANERVMKMELFGDNMGVLIGKRGQTLDSLQYLISLYLNRESDSFIRLKLDTENYRDRRKENLENFANNIASKVKRTRRPVSLEPMNPYERRIIHSALQNDKNVMTKSEGEEPYRKVVVMLKK